jgi:hypothetical protein
VLVAEVLTGIDESTGLDDERRLAVGDPRLDEAGDLVVAQEATPLIS